MKQFYDTKNALFLATCLLGMAHLAHADLVDFHLVNNTPQPVNVAFMTSNPAVCKNTTSANNYVVNSGQATTGTLRLTHQQHSLSCDYTMTVKNSASNQVLITKQISVARGNSGNPLQISHWENGDSAESISAGVHADTKQTKSSGGSIHINTTLTQI